VEFGPAGAGHHGPEEWVSIASLGRYRRVLVDFARSLGSPRLEAVEDVGGTQAA
jgi:succinyl-diaminopimelate desuccinylase